MNLVGIGILSRPRGRTTIKLAVPSPGRGRRRPLRNKWLSPLPDGNALQNQSIIGV